VTETQQRFLKANAERIPMDRIVEVRVFPPIRQGQLESAVAVVAVEGLEAPVTEREVALEVTAGDARADGDPPMVEVPAPPAPSRATSRFSIVTARYRLAIKGPDRGTWEFDLVHDADAPLDAVERVVRGVAHRVGEGGDPDLLSAMDFQRAVTEPWFIGREPGMGNRES
jgi:hypothetical protein